MSLISIKNGLFRAFQNPITLEIGAKERWAVLGAAKTALLEIFAAKHTPQPATALRYPTIGYEHWPAQVISYVKFGGSSNKAPYIAARYESFRDEFDYTLGSVLRQISSDESQISRVVDQLHLNGLEDRWIVGLSNGQTRRAQIAQALLKNPEILVIDDPFLGLDPVNRELLDTLLKSLPLHVIMGVISSSDLPKWIDHVAVAETEGVVSGPIGTIKIPESRASGRPLAQRQLGENVIELNRVSVAYRGEPIFQDLQFTARRGERVHIKGPNGSGKSTLLALITADHPQSWNERVVLFGRPREVGKQSYNSINHDIGHSSPEIHSIFPRWLSVKRAIATGFGSDFTPHQLDSEQEGKVAKWAKRFELDLDTKFGDLNITNQKLVLFARALVKDPEILILDEAFSAFDASKLELAFSVLDEFPGTVLAIGHVESELPAVHQVLELKSRDA